MNGENLIVALDCAHEDEARDLVGRLGDRVGYYKVGLELFLNTRGGILEFLKQQGKNIFLDLKFHDIPNTVAQAAAWAASSGADMFTLHATGGAEMLRAAVDAVADICGKRGLKMPRIVGVTILTSFDEAGIARVGFKEPIGRTVCSLARLCQESGLGGVVCSPHEVTAIKQACGEEFLTVCPGIRPVWAAKGDQKRITTPSDAVRLGVDYMVVGRPITRAENPQEAARKILEEIGGETE